MSSTFYLLAPPLLIINRGDTMGLLQETIREYYHDKLSKLEKQQYLDEKLSAKAKKRLKIAGGVVAGLGAAAGTAYAIKKGKAKKAVQAIKTKLAVAKANRAAKKAYRKAHPKDFLKRAQKNIKRLDKEVTSLEKQAGIK